jgi:diadenosine tetraphosphate (Ap4A) HIT family hydrolase
MKIYSNSHIFIEIHESEIPWLKVFTTVKHKEFSHCSTNEKMQIWRALDIIERLMLEYYKPEKINIASFGNMLPHVHWHIMARFKQDSYFPEPMWGKRQRDAQLQLPDFDDFIDRLIVDLDKTS